MVHNAAQGQEEPQDVGIRDLAVEATWAGKAQQGPPPPPPSPAYRMGSPKQQTISGETSRGRSPEPDPTGTEDSPLSQVPPIPSFTPVPPSRPVPPSHPVPPLTPNLWKQFLVCAVNILGQDLLSDSRNLAQSSSCAGSV